MSPSIAQSPHCITLVDVRALFEFCHKGSQLHHHLPSLSHHPPCISSSPQPSFRLHLSTTIFPSPSFRLHLSVSIFPSPSFRLHLSCLHLPVSTFLSPPSCLHLLVYIFLPKNTCWILRSIERGWECISRLNGTGKRFRQSRDSRSSSRLEMAEIGGSQCLYSSTTASSLGEQWPRTRCARSHAQPPLLHEGCN